MSKAVLIDTSSNARTALTGKTRVGRAEDNTLVVPGRQCSRHHCVIYHGLLGGWKLKQLVKEGKGPQRQSASYIGRGGRLITVVSGKTCKLQTGDKIAFGQPSGAGEVRFSHVFWTED